MEKHRFFTPETIKTIFIVILVPLAVTALGYSTEQKGISDKLDTIQTALITMQKDQKRENTSIGVLSNQTTNLFQSQKSDSEKLSMLNNSIINQGKDIVKLGNSISSIKTSISDIRQNTIPGGNERIQRLENKIFK